MILDDDPIDLAPLLLLLELAVELDYLDLPAGESAFENERVQRGLEEAVVDFAANLDDRSEQEAEVRRGLCWLLHQEDVALADILRRANMGFPTPDIGERRRYLEIVWEQAFSSWKVQGFNNDDYEVVGIP